MAHDAVAVPDRGPHAADLSLAAACARGDRAAIRKLEATVFGDVDAALGTMKLAPFEREEVLQRLRIHLFTRSGGEPPRIAGYAGRGPLRAWVRVAAIRTALNMRRDAREVPVDDARLADLPSLCDSPQLSRLRADSRAQLEQALGRALRMLARRDRTMLRQHYLDGLRLGELADLHGLHRVTAARHLERARGQLATKLRTVLHRDLGANESEIDSLVRLAASGWDRSLRPLFQSGRSHTR